jgi:hypothetical protein
VINPRFNIQAALLNSAKVAETWPLLLTLKTSIPLTSSLPSGPLVPLMETQRQAILVQLLKISRVERKSAGCLVELEMKEETFEKVTCPSYE